MISEGRIPLAPSWFFDQDGTVTCYDTASRVQRHGPTAIPTGQGLTSRQLPDLHNVGLRIEQLDYLV
jgi:hypothetical protein